ncbi:MAG: hypothetical protein ACREV5_03400 [Steroidobacter sp.]
MQVLQVIEGAYRATLEEQDDPAVWITQAMRGAGGDFTLLLRGNAVNYACSRQDAAGLQVGAWTQKQPPDLLADFSRLAGAGVTVYALQEDLEARGVPADTLRTDIEVIRRRSLPEFMERFDQIWCW